MAPVKVSFLDPLHENIEAAVRRHAPDDWSLTFANSREHDAQLQCIASADAALLIGMPVPASLIDASPNLRFVQKLGIGVDKIDLEACRKRGIAVARIAGGNATPVAEHALMLMLATLRRLPLIDRRTRQGEWQKEESRGIHRQISGRTVGIVGFGAIGRALAQLLTGFDARVVFYDPQPCPPDVATHLQAEPLELDELIRASDIISLHLPLLAETRKLINRERISRMKPGTILVNCARGGLVDETALLQALDAGHVMGAGLDVFENEPPSGNLLLASDATVVTPHLAGATFDNFVNVLKRGIENTQAFRETRPFPPADVVVCPET